MGALILDPISFHSTGVSVVIQGTISQPDIHVETERLSCQSLLPFEKPRCFLVIQIHTQDFEKLAEPTGRTSSSKRYGAPESTCEQTLV